MGRYKPDDFGYSFAEEEKASLVTDSPLEEHSTSNVEMTTIPTGGDEDLEYSLYEDQHGEDSFRFRPPKRYRGGESLVAQDNMSGSPGNAIICTGAVCCCLTIALVIAGGVLISYEQYKDSDAQQLAGAIILVLAAGACICGCCTFCLGAITEELELSGSTGGSKEDPNYKEVKVRLRRLNDRYEKGCLKAEDNLQKARLNVVGHMKEIKEAARKETKEKREKDKKNREELEKRVKNDIKAGVPVKTICQKYRPVTFFIEFNGDVMVSNLELLRKQVSIVVNLGKKGHDQCVVAITSPGGAVSQYGLAASQLVRIRKAGIHLTVCIDTVAASGGYMMAAVADKICAAPFAVVGSIGVVTQIPNFQRFLNEHKVDAYLMTAGNYKRTVDIIGEVTEEGKAKLKEQLDDIHIAFKDHVAFARPKLKEIIGEVSTGEHWLAVQAKEKGLVDMIMTSDEYLEAASENFDIIEVLEKKQKRGLNMFMSPLGEIASSVQSILKRFQSTIESPETSPLPMAIV